MYSEVCVLLNMLRRQFSHESGKTELVKAREEYFDRRYVANVIADRYAIIVIIDST